MQRPRRSAFHLLLAGCVALVVGCSGDELGRDDNGVVTKPGPADVFELQVGDCLVGEVEEEVTEVPLVPCDTPHTHEVFHLAEHPEGPYPGSAAIEVFAEQACVGAFADYVGVELAESIYYFTYLFPSVSTWNDEEDRQIVCFVVSRDAEITGSVKGSNT